MSIRRCLSALLLAASAPVMAGSFEVSVELPRLDVAEYHKPYLAVWVETPEQRFVANLAVRYDLDARDNKGTEWLKDLRQWWRRSGRTLSMPVDGISGATVAPGVLPLSFDTAGGPLASLTPGQYRLVVEAARESGGRELLDVPFTWPASAQTQQAQGSTELGRVQLSITP